MTSLLSDDECVRILSKTHKDFDLVETKIERFSDSTLGYLGEHLQLKLFYTLTNSGAVHQATYFIKCVPRESNEQKEFVEQLGVIRREGTVHERLITKLQKVATTPFTAEFYYKRDDLIVFDDLTVKGFRLSSDQYLGESKVKAVLKSVASMHAAYINVEEEKRTSDKTYQLFKLCEEELTDNKYDFVEGHPRNNWYQASTRCVAKLSQYFTGETKFIPKIFDYFKNEMPEIEDVSSNFRNVLCHNDLWLNNLMFDEDECRLVDFQLAKYGPPAFDVLTFLYFNLEARFLRDNMREFVDFYYKRIQIELRNAHLEAEGIMPEDEFLESVEAYRKPCLFQVCICATFIYVSHEFSQRTMNDKELYQEYTFGERFRYVLEEMKGNAYFEERLRNVIMQLCEMFE